MAPQNIIDIRLTKGEVAAVLKLGQFALGGSSVDMNHPNFFQQSVQDAS